MSELRILGVVCGTVMLLFAVLRRRSRAMTRGEALLTALAGLTLMAVSFYPPLINGAIERTGTRLMALAILGNLALFGLVLYLMQAVSGVRQELGELVRALARSEYERSHGGESRSGGVAVVIPAYNEAHSLRQLLPSMPLDVCGMPVRAVVVLDGCSDASLRVVRDARTPVTAHAINRGQGDALRTGFALALQDGAEIVVTMDADGQHRPGEIERLVRPIADGNADLVVGSRFAGAYADRGSVRHAGVLGFSWFMSRLTGVQFSDCTNGFRAIRASSLPTLRLRETRFSAPELLLESVAAGLRIVEVPVTIEGRAEGLSKKPPTLRYGFGFGLVILRTWLRS